jgi:drug/metabolite transporter (DMT)-like permease
MASPLPETGAATARGGRLTSTDEHVARARAHPRFGITDVSLVLMALIWGVNFSFVKYGTTVLDPLAYNAVRVALAAVALVLIAQLSTRLAGPVATGWPARRDAIALASLGTLGNGLYQIFFVEGVARTRAGDAALVIAASPAFIALIGRIRGSEHVRARGVTGIVLSVLGIGLVVIGGTEAGGVGTHRATLLGDLLVLAGCLCWSVYTVWLQPYTHRVGGLHLSALTMVGGMIPLLAVAAPAITRASWSNVPALAWGAIVYSGLGALVVAYLFWYRGVRVLGPTRTAMYSNLQPLFALIVAWLALGETPSVWQGAGAISIIGGLWLTRT